ncbi:MAG: ABC transporter permease subunit [Pseudomonadota bacterium]
MWVVVIKKISSAIISILSITLVIFLLLKTANTQSLDAILLNDNPLSDTSLITQYRNYLTNIINGNWGYSSINNQPILQEVIALIPATIELTFFATLMALLIGLIAGTVATIFRHTFIDFFVLLISFVGYSVPIFWWGLITMLVISLDWGLTPVSGRIGFLFDIEPITGFMLVDVFLNDVSNRWEAIKSIFNHLILPAMVLATVPLSIIARTIRAALIEILQKDHILSAFARGISGVKIYWIHAIRNALAQSMPIFAMQIGALVMGAIITETIFSWPGLGKWLIESLNRGDFPAVHGSTIMLIFIIIVINSLLDIASAIINPRLRKF